MEKIFNCFLVLVAVVSLFFAVYYRVERNKLCSRLECYRMELELSRAKSAEYADIIVSARATNTELGNCLSRNISTLSELREQLQKVRANYEKMEDIIYSISIDNISSDRVVSD